MGVIVSPPPPKTDVKFDDWMYLFWKNVMTVGAGGIVYQSTSKSTDITFDHKFGAIVMDGAALADATSVSFTMYNSYLEATDVPALSIGAGASPRSYLSQVDSVSKGQCLISLRNISGGSLSEAVQLNFSII